MKYLKNIVLVFGLALSSLSVQAQLISLSTGNIQNLPDTVAYGDTVQNWSVWIKNTGNLPVSGLWLDVEGTIGNLPGISTLGGDSIPVASPVAPGDSIEIPLDYFVVSPSNSNNGSNVVVVWPAAPNVTPEDSTEDDYYVDPETSVPEAFNVHASLSVYPNPASDYLSVSSPHPIRPERIRIYDLNGKLAFETDGQGNRLQLSGLAPGTYLLQVFTDNEAPLVTRFIKN